MDGESKRQDGTAGGALTGVRDNVAVGSAADNNFSFPMSIDPEGRQRLRAL